MSQNSPKQWFNLEERFYNEIDNRLLDKLRSKMSKEQTAEDIMRLTGLTDVNLATKIAELQVTVETLAAFRLVPLIAVAWADDRVDTNEEYAIKIAAEKAGIAEDSAEMELIRAWTRARPPAELFDAWCEYARALANALAEEHRQTLLREMMQQVKSVATAAGGMLGFGSISSTEQAVIDRVVKSLS